MSNESQKLEIALSLANTQADYGADIAKYVDLPKPEEAFKNATDKPPFASLAVGAITRLDWLFRNIKLIGQLPPLSIGLYGQTYGPSPEIAYKYLIIMLANYGVYCLGKLDDIADGKAISVCRTIAANPEVLLIVRDNEDIGSFSIAVKYAVLATSFTYLIRLFSKFSEAPAPLECHLLKMATMMAAPLLGWERSSDPILNWGTEIVSKSAGSILTECIKNMRGNILEYMGLHNRFRGIRLLDLARAEENLQQSLGARLYNEFERELTRFFESFGYFVSPTKPGKRRVDLVVTTLLPNQYSFLVDAKSCKSTYSLPTADERELTEYAKTFTAGNSYLPELRFILVVSSKPTKSLRVKLDRLSTTLGVPVRFVAARHLHSLRNQIPGSISSKVLFESIASSDPILDDKWVRTIAKNMSDKAINFDSVVGNIFGDLH